MSTSFTAQAFAKTLLGAVEQSSRDTGDSSKFASRLCAILERLWLSSTEGNACIELNVEDLFTVRHSAASTLFGQNKPLMLDEHFLFLNRFWYAESRLAQAVHVRLIETSERSAASEANARNILPAPLPASQNDIDDHLMGLAPAQVQAVLSGLARKLSLIYGGPGTGKTRTIASLMLCYARLNQKPIWVAAPTAKAGARLMESLQTVLDQTLTDLNRGEPERLAETQYLPSEALTIQRLLSRLPSKEILFSDYDRPEAAWMGPGLLIVDEASMLSLDLCDQLFAKLSPDCSLILVGDPNQLHSVETGSVFASLCEAEWPALKVVRVQLTRNFRQSDRINLTHLAEAVLLGKLDPTLFTDELSLCPPVLATLIEAAAKRFRAMQLEAQSQCTLSASPRERALAYLRGAAKYRLLSARRSGFAGADRLSEAILLRLKALQHVGHQTWFEGRMITITKNDAASGLFNGDTGVCVLVTDAANETEFATSDPIQAVIVFERQGVILTIAAAALPRFQNAYCLSVHQSQGSEFEHVDFVAAPSGHRLATRELLYTAVTRAKHSLTVWGEVADLQWAASRATVRHSRLQWKLDHPEVG